MEFLNDFFGHILAGEKDGVALGVFLTLFGAHVVNTCPVPDNKWLRWVLGWFQFVFAFRGRSANTLQNSDTVTVGVPKGAELQTNLVPKGTGDGRPV